MCIQIICDFYSMVNRRVRPFSKVVPSNEIHRNLNWMVKGLHQRAVEFKTVHTTQVNRYHRLLDGVWSKKLNWNSKCHGNHKYHNKNPISSDNAVLSLDP